jgi:hypothetical protein
VTQASAPDFTLVAVGSRRRIHLAALRGRAVLLLFADATTAKQSRDVVVGLRRRYPEFERLAIAVVVDLRSVPGLLRGMAEGIMETAYRGAAAEVPAGHDPADHLILLQDWDGKVTAAYGHGQSSRQVRFVLLNGDGQIVARYAGSDPPGAALQAVSALLDPPAP